MFSREIPNQRQKSCEVRYWIIKWFQMLVRKASQCVWQCQNYLWALVYLMMWKLNWNVKPRFNDGVLPMKHYVKPPPMQGNDLFLNDMLKNVNIIPRSISLSIYLAIYIHIYNKNMYEGVLTYFICKIRMLIK